MAVDDTSRVGEVVESGSTAFVAQSYRLYGAPPLGALVRTGGPCPAYAVVHDVATRGIDPGRRPLPRGESEAVEQDVYDNNPQLEHLLRTEFRAVIVGHVDGGETRYRLPPSPPPIYAFVYACPAAEVAAFTSSADSLRLLAGSGVAAAEEVVSAFLRHAMAAHGDPTAYLAGAGRQLAALFPRDFRTVESILLRAAQ